MNYFSQSCGHLLIATIGLTLTLSCSLRRPAPTLTIAYLQERKNEVRLQEENFQAVFKKCLEKYASVLPHPELIRNFYERKNYQPVLVPRFLPEHQLRNLLRYFMNTGKHGLDPEFFLTQRLQYLLQKAEGDRSGAALKTYHELVELELTVLSSLTKYSNALQFGITDPSKVYPRYSIPTLTPDSSAVLKIFEINNLKKFLDSIQPTDPTYLALQKELMINEQDSLKEHEKIRKTILVNLERLRWKNKPDAMKYVLVNIPDFSLHVIEKGKSILYMKVCVGEPGRRQSPQLGSDIEKVQVNPVWNIPASIARNEITKQAADDRYYLANNNINVYRKGKLVEDPEDIDWSSADPDDYTFQQQPGPENALGKIKFLFPNKSSVYLHDTPVKAAFDQKNLAISHGCIRVQKPLELAYALFGKTEKYEQIKKAIQSGYPKAKFVALSPSVPIRIVYFTAKSDRKGHIQYHDDIYGLDDILYEQMEKFR